MAHHHPHRAHHRHVATHALGHSYTRRGRMMLLVLLLLGKRRRRN
jgi:hypothetical protein